MKDKYTMVMTSERYAESWVIYPTDGNYIDDKLCELPGGSNVLNRAAAKVLEAMNGKND